MISLNYNFAIDNNPKVNNKNLYATSKPLKNDVFFKGIRNIFNLDLAKTIKDIPKDANIFIHSPKSKVKIPPNTNVEECILTDRGASIFKKLFKDYDKNIMEVKGCNVSYAHGEFLESNIIPWGGIRFNNSTVEQVENTRLVQLVNNSKVKLARNVHYAEAEKSTIDNIECFQDLELKEANNIGSAKALNIICKNGNNIDDAKCIYFESAPDYSNPERYTTINKLEVTNRADISQAKINYLKANIAQIRNSIIKKIDLDAMYRLYNTKAEEVNVNALCQASNCKIEKLTIAENYCNSIMRDKIQINELNLESAQANLFIFPKQEWGKKCDNYIKKINISQNKQSSKPYTPTLKIQGEIDIDEINFVGQRGIVEFTSPKKTNKEIKVTNGEIRFNVPKTEVPSYLYDKFPPKY